MIILDHPLEGAPIIIAHPYILLDYQCFTLEQAKQYFEKKPISKTLVNSILQAYKDNQKNLVKTVEDYKVILPETHWSIKKELAKINDPKLLELLMDEQDPNIRMEVAKHPNKKLLNTLAKDPSNYVRQQVAKHGFTPILNQMVKDSCIVVKQNICAHKQSSLASKLAKDSDASIRAMVAKTNPESVFDALYQDKSILVRLELSKRCKLDSHLEKLSLDKHYLVRSSVAKYDNLSILKVLVKDPNACVRAQVATHYHKDILSELQNDSSKIVRKQVRSTIRRVKGNLFTRVYNYIFSQKNSENSILLNTKAK